MKYQLPKSKQKTKSSRFKISNPFKKKHPVYQANRDNITGLSPKKGKTHVSNKKRNPGIKIPKFISTILAFGLIGTLGLAISYFAFQYVMEIKTKHQNVVASDEKIYIAGISDIPAYPKSEFIFEDNKENDNVKSFLNTGRTVYRVPAGTTSEEVYEFYKAELAKKSWEHVLTVPVNDDSKRYGEYWIKETTGLRIYTRLNDIWYEMIKSDEARSGLANEVAEENQRKLAFNIDGNIDLLPDFPWELSYPQDYLVSYTETEINEVKSANFRKIGGEVSFIIQPLNHNNKGSYEELLRAFLQKPIGEETWLIAESGNVNIYGNDAFQATITSDGKSGKVYVISNTRNSIAYAFISLTEDEQFMNYVMQNVKSKAQKIRGL